MQLSVQLDIEDDYAIETMEEIVSLDTTLTSIIDFEMPGSDSTQRVELLQTNMGLQKTRKFICYRIHCPYCKKNTPAKSYRALKFCGFFGILKMPRFHLNDNHFIQRKRYALQDWNQDKNKRIANFEI